MGRENGYLISEFHSCPRRWSDGSGLESRWSRNTSLILPRRRKTTWRMSPGLKESGR